MMFPLAKSKQLQQLGQSPVKSSGRGLGGSAVKMMTKNDVFPSTQGRLRAVFNLKSPCTNALKASALSQKRQYG